MLVDMDDVELTDNEIKLACYGAVHVYICRISNRCSDNWRTKFIARAASMLEDMGFPWKGELEDLKTEFVRLRKNDRQKKHFPAVLSPNKANKKKQ
jgi:hypothetical protein